MKLRRFLYQRMMTEQAVDSLGYVFVWTLLDEYTI